MEKACSQAERQPCAATLLDDVPERTCSALPTGARYATHPYHRGTQMQPGGHHGNECGERHTVTEVVSMSYAVPVRGELHVLRTGAALKQE